MNTQPKSKKKIIIIVLVLVLAFLVLQGLFLIGYQALNKRVKRGEMEGWCITVEEHMKNDASFTTPYGEVLSVKLDTNKDWEISGENDLGLPCMVSTADGKTYSVWVEFNVKNLSETITYVSVELVADAID